MSRFVDLFAEQNWRHRQWKDRRDDGRLAKGEGGPSPITRREVWQDALGMFREESLNNLLEEAIKDKTASTKIAEGLAKSMLLDGFSFEKAAKHFWFSPARYEPLRKKVEKLIPELEKRELAKKHVKEWDGMDIVRSDKPTGESVIAVDVEGQEETIKVEIPDRLTSVADLTERLPFHEQKKPKRVGVNMRMRTDCSEILKLSAAASNMSVTQFVEELALVHASSLVRSHIETFEQDGKNADAALGSNLYDSLCVRYEKNGFFPRKIEDMEKQPIRNYDSRWFPFEDDKGRVPLVGSRTTSLQVFQEMIKTGLRMGVNNAKKLTTLHKYMELVRNTKESTDDWRPIFEEFLGKYTQSSEVLEEEGEAASK